MIIFLEFVEIRTFSTSVSSPSPSPFSPFIVSHFLLFLSSSFRLSKCWERKAFTFLFLFLGTRVSRFFSKIWKLAWYHKKARTKLKKYFCNTIMLILVYLAIFLFFLLHISPFFSFFAALSLSYYSDRAPPPFRCCLQSFFSPSPPPHPWETRTDYGIYSSSCLRKKNFKRFFTQRLPWNAIYFFAKTL